MTPSITTAARRTLPTMSVLESIKTRVVSAK
jgi:hypothetical protein